MGVLLCVCARRSTEIISCVMTMCKILVVLRRGCTVVKTTPNIHDETADRSEQYCLDQECGFRLFTGPFHTKKERVRLGLQHKVNAR